MNKITKVLRKVVGEVGLWGIVTTGCVASMLTVGAVIVPAQAATFMADVMRPGVPGSSYNGNWMFDVVLDLVMNKIIFTVTTSNSPSGNQYSNYMYIYGVTESNGKYTFDGFDMGVPANTNGLKMKGMYTPSSQTLIIDNSIMSGPINFEVSNIKLVPDTCVAPAPSPKNRTSASQICRVPEPTSTLSLLALGTLGAASTLKRKQKQKQIEKETTKVG